MEYEWIKAHRPNYVTNADLKYPYSELPYLGEYHLQRIPIDDKLVEHVDYWGEGRIETSAGNSGFRACYNVNWHYQLVTKGSDKGCKIPNRIPVIDEDSCDTSKYIINNCVKLVTLMGAPINESCARDIARIVNRAVGSVVIFGFESNSAGFRRLTMKLSEISLFYCPGYKLPDYLQGLTLFDTHIAYLTAEEVKDRLYNALTAWNIDTAVAITRSLHNSGGSFVIANVVDKVLDEGILSTMTFAYKLWDSGEKDIVNKYFSYTIYLILQGVEFEIVSSYYKNTKLKLDSNEDEWKNRLAWGIKSFDRDIQFSWKTVPSFKGDIIYFKIKNIKYNMFLRHDIHANSAGDSRCCGSKNIEDDSFDWMFIPLRDMKVIIKNYKSNQTLELDNREEENGKRQLWATKKLYGCTLEWIGQSFKTEKEYLVKNI